MPVNPLGCGGDHCAINSSVSLRVLAHLTSHKSQQLTHAPTRSPRRRCAPIPHLFDTQLTTPLQCCKKCKWFELDWLLEQAEFELQRGLLAAVPQAWPANEISARPLRNRGGSVVKELLEIGGVACVADHASRFTVMRHLVHRKPSGAR